MCPGQPYELQRKLTRIALLCRVIVTASEDNTCRFWDAHGGALLKELRCHQGRGVWTCSVDNGDRLVTGGGDGALRAWRLRAWLPAAAAALLDAAVDAGSVQQGAAAPLTDASKGAGPRPLRLLWPGAPRGAAAAADGEHTGQPTRPQHEDAVRAMAFVRSGELVAVTKRGALHLARLRANQEPETVDSGCAIDENGQRCKHASWTTLWAAPAGTGPLNCVAVRGHPADGGAVANGLEPPSRHLVATGDQAGFVTVLEVSAAADCAPRAAVLFRFQLHPGEPVLGVFGFSTLPIGSLLLGMTDNALRWVHCEALAAQSSDPVGQEHAAEPNSCAASGCAVLAECRTTRKHRVVSADVDVQHRVVVLGDVSGGVTAFAFPPQLLRVAASEPATEPVQLRMLANLGTCHGNTPVTMVKCVGPRRILTGGRNGAHALDKAASRSLVRAALQQLISAVHYVRKQTVPRCR